ncbi:MAG: B12-binding domain-containing radical SAM protein [Planctomycetota bacterium]
MYPKIPDTTYWGFSHALNILGKRALLPPLGLLTVAAMLPAGDEVRLKDLNIESCSDDDLRWADAVFVSAMIVQKDSLAECIGRANALGIPVVAGGAYPTTSYAEIEGVSHFLLGETETIFPVFLRDWAQGRAKRVYARPIEAADTEAIRAHFGADADLETATERICLDDTPMPRFDLLDLGAYKSMAIQTSRGCPHGCEFCDIWRRFGKRMRYRSPEHILAELTTLYRLGWRSSVFLVDDNLVGNPTLAKRLLGSIASWQRAHQDPFDFCTEASLTLADDPELLRQMASAGCDMVFVGLETPAEESLQETRKFVNTTGCMGERVRRIQAAGIQVSSGFILGFDNDPDDIAERMIRCIHDLGVPVAMVGLLQAFPGTDLYDRLKREGRLQGPSDGNNTHEFALSFVPRRPAGDLIADYKRVLQSLYSNTLKSYFARCAILRAHWHPPRAKSKRVRAEVVGWLVRYLVTSVFHPYLWNSLRFLLTTLWRKPRFFPIAASLAVQGHHFRAITRLAFSLDALQQTYAELANAYLAHLTEERERFLVEIRVALRDGQEDLNAHGDAVLRKIEAYRQSILDEACHATQAMSRAGRAHAQRIYGSLSDRVDRATNAFRRRVEREWNEAVQGGSGEARGETG